MVVKKIKGLLGNNERQKVINKDTIDRINLLTNRTNNILRTLQSLQEVRRTIEESIANKLKIVKDEIDNIEYALQWAKVGVINSFLLSEKEMGEAKTFLDFEKFPYNNLEEALGFASIRIATNENMLIYIINLPAIEQLICAKLLIKPVKRNNTILKIDSEYFLKCNNDLYEINKQCNKVNELTIGNRDNLLEVSNSNCVKRILNSKNHNCTIINNQHIPSVQELFQGTIFLNEFEGFVEISRNKS